MKEIDSTMASASDDEINNIISAVTNAGGNITLDESNPVYADLGDRELETGFERIIEFSLAKTDYRITRTVQEYKITGTGRHKGVEKMTNPWINTKMQKKAENTEQWQLVDIEDLF